MRAGTTIIPSPPLPAGSPRAPDHRQIGTSCTASRAADAAPSTSAFPRTPGTTPPASGPPCWASAPIRVAGRSFRPPYRPSDHKAASAWRWHQHHPREHPGSPTTADNRYAIGNTPRYVPDTCVAARRMYTTPASEGMHAQAPALEAGSKLASLKIGTQAITVCICEAATSLTNLTIYPDQDCPLHGSQ